MDSWNEEECTTESTFAKSNKITSQQRTVFSGEEALACFCRYTDLVSRFGRNLSKLCLIFDEVQDLEPAIFITSTSRSTVADAIRKKGSLLDNCFGFLAGQIDKLPAQSIN